MKKLLLLILSLIIILSLSVFFISEEGYKIGFVAGLTGKYSSMGVEERNGFLLAIKEINQDGGINGKKVVYEIKDDENSPQRIKEVFREFAKDGFKIVVGPATSYMAKEALPIIHSYTDMLVISPTVSSGELKGLDDNFIRLDNTYQDDSMKTLVDFMLSRDSETNTTLLIYDTTNPTYSTRWAERFTQEFESRDRKVVAKGLNGSNNFLENLHGVVVENEFDSCVLVLNASNTALTAQKIFSIKPTSLYAAGWALEEELISDGGEAVEKIVLMTTFNPFSKNPDFVEFKKRYKEMYNKEPSSFATQAYDSVMFIKSALQKDSEIKNLKKNLIGSFNGANREIILDRYGDLANPESILLEVKGGEFVKAEP